MYEDEARLCLEITGKLGATYADARFLNSKTLTLQVDDAGFTSRETFELSFGVRVIADGMWGFAGANKIDRRYCNDVATRAVKIAKLAAKGSKGKIRLAPTSTQKGTYSNSIRKDPFEISVRDIADLLTTSARIVKDQSSEIKSASAGVYAFQEDKYIANSEGSAVFQRSVGCGPSMSGSAVSNGKVLRRSYPESLGWDISTRGYESIEEADLQSNAKIVGGDVVKLINAGRCRNERTDLIIYGDLLAIHVHETVGHATESDRATDTEWDFAGSSFLTPEKRGNFQFGSECVNIVADATIPNGTGSYDFDDELVPGKRISLIEKGLFCGYQSSRETAMNLGLGESSGAMRAMYGTRIPLIRMTNINLEPGDWSRDEIIKDTKDGILATGAILAIFDQRRRTFIFGGEIGWRIANGDVREAIKFPIYSDTSVNLWKSCDAISKEDLECFGVSCGKGRPHQSMRVGHFCSTARFRGVPVGDPTAQ